MKSGTAALILSKRLVKTGKFIFLFTYSVVLILFTASFAIEMLTPLYLPVLG